LVAREEHLILIIISPHTLALTVLLIFRAGRRAFLSVSHAHKNNVMIYVSAAREAKSGTSNHNCPLSSLSLSQVSVFRLTSRCVHQRRCLCLPLMISVVVVVVCWRVSLSADSLGNNLTAICWGAMVSVDSFASAADRFVFYVHALKCHNPLTCTRWCQIKCQVRDPTTDIHGELI